MIFNIKKDNPAYPFIFALIVCVVCGVLLSFFSEALRERQELNVELDIKKNILKVVGLREPIPAEAAPQEVLKIYEEKIHGLVIDEQGNVVEGRKPDDIKEGENNLHPLYIYKEGEEVVAYAFPMVGQGLWSTLYGYFSLEKDAITVRGITYYKHGETPGLGGEIEKDWFQSNFKGKTIYSLQENKLTPIVVAKGKAEGQVSEEKLKHYVDGITAATITGAGVTQMIERTLKIYETYFSKVRQGA